MMKWEERKKTYAMTKGKRIVISDDKIISIKLTESIIGGDIMRISVVAWKSFLQRFLRPNQCHMTLLDE